MILVNSFPVINCSNGSNVYLAETYCHKKLSSSSSLRDFSPLFSLRGQSLIVLDKI